MASLSGQTNYQQLSDLGVLAAGYRLYTYLPNTTTHTNVYTDSAGATPHTYTSDGSGGQYIALNSRGEVPGNLYVNSGGVDLCLKTAAGSTVWTRRAIGQADGATTLDTAVRADIASTSDLAKGDDLVGVKRDASGSVARTQHDKNEELVSVLDHGSGVAGLPVSMALGGGTYIIPRGSYTYTSTLEADYSNVAFPDYLTPSTRVSLKGDSLHSTFLNYNGTSGTYGLTLTGPASIANLGVYQQGLFQDFVLQDLGTTRNRHGITITNQSTAEFNRLNVTGFDHGTYINSSLSLIFRNVVWTYNNIGCVLDSTTGQALPNALSFEACEWNGNIHQAIVANVVGATNRFTSCRIESCGTHATSGDGGLFFNISPTNGPASLTIESCYFEGNGGDADLQFTNTGTEDVTVIVKGCTFNRVSSSKYVTSNIVGANSSSGKLRIVLIGNAFFSTGTYVANSGRPFLNLADTKVQFIDGGGNTFSETTSDVVGFAGAYGLSANFDSTGGTVSAPSGVTCVKDSTGNYTVTGAVPFGKGANDYTVQITTHVPFGAVARYQRVSSTVFTVHTAVPNTGSAADADFSVTVFRIK
jgi:hypothetical protein